MRAGYTLVIALAVMMTAGCALSRAQEPRRVVVMKFKGSKAKKLQALVADLVGKHHKVVSDKRYRKTARKLKARRMRARHIKKVATELGIDAVVEGKLVRRSRRKYTLRIQVRDASGA
jgi:signal recognition particle subunit SEC65